ncbi:MAG: phosphocholine cytidylyltransferase family protein [Alphaproteobacteria bacterium]|nr:phosphocholine cytidylyltransferase family protein [Alphaproteobacteria bacterium]
MKALIIGAGQGKRLLPLTEEVPKALLEVGGKSLLEWQVDHLIECGVREIVFIAGFNAAGVEAAMDALAEKRPGLRLRPVFNPFHAITDNLVSVWMARAEMTGDFVLVNSDTLFSAPVLETLLASAPAPVTVAIDHKDKYDDDDMKVELDGVRLIDVSKTIEPDRVHGESIGMLLFRGEGPRQFVDALERAMLDEASLRRWYLSVVADLAARFHVTTATISGHDWCEIDYPHDLQVAKEMVAGWRPGRTGDLPLTGSS